MGNVVEKVEDLSSYNPRSSLPWDVQLIISRGIRHGFEGDQLNLYAKGIDKDMMPELCEWVIKLGDKIKTLNLYNNNITSNQGSPGSEITGPSNSNANDLVLDSNGKLVRKSIKALGEMIKNSKFIEEINLSITNISDSDVEALAPYFNGNTTLKSITFDANFRITDRSIPFFIKIIESSHLGRLSVLNTSVTQINNMAVALARNMILSGSSSLYLATCGITDDDVIRICEDIKVYGSGEIKELNFSGNNITSKGASVLFDTLKECNSVLSYLDLCFNNINDESMAQLGEFIESSQFFENLLMKNCNISDKGIEILASYLIGNTVMKKIDMDHNIGITNKSVEYVIEVAKTSCLTLFSISYRSITKEKKLEIQEAFKIPTEKREIPIKSNTKSAAKISAST